MNRLLKSICYSAIALCLLISPFARQETSALSSDQYGAYKNGIYYFDVKSSALCSTATTATGAATNLDYAGRKILTDAQLQKISEYSSVYQQAAQTVDIPWQMIAVIHVRETGLGKENPSNGQGIYQIASKAGGPYPTGPVSDEEFLRQTEFVANFIKNKAGSNYQGHKQLASSSDAETIKDTFFSYNGRANAYENQAALLGYNAATQGYEGSPYVMNKADAKRDPEQNPTGWGQIKTDGGGIVYPANGDYGAFVQYAALTGAGLGGCGVSGPVREKVITLTRQELELWNSGQLTPGTGLYKYSQNRDENWCADFASWIYNQAGYPLISTNEGNVASVSGIKAIGEKGGSFQYHESAGYTPRPGDLAIHQATGVSHVNIVVAVSGQKITLIGGNQGGGGGQGEFYASSKVTESTITGASSDNIVGYVTPD